MPLQQGEQRRKGSGNCIVGSLETHGPEPELLFPSIERRVFELVDTELLRNDIGEESQRTDQSDATEHAAHQNRIEVGRRRIQSEWPILIAVVVGTNPRNS